MPSWMVRTAIVFASCGSLISAPSSLGFDGPPARAVAGCQPPAVDAVGTVDVAIVIDTSRSTADPSGSDIDTDGLTGHLELSAMTDPGDSLLAAEVAGIRSLLRNTAEFDVRFSIVTFSGLMDPTPPYPLKHIVRDGDAAVRSELTDDVGALEAALHAVLGRGSSGYTHFAAGMRRATRTLSGTPPSRRSARRLVLFISDSTHPILIGGNERIQFRDPLMYEVANDAIDARIVFDTFGLGRAADSPPPHALSRIATATGGTYRAVEDPTMLHCHLLNSLARKP